MTNPEPRQAGDLAGLARGRSRLQLFGDEAGAHVRTPSSGRWVRIRESCQTGTVDGSPPKAGPR